MHGRGSAVRTRSLHCLLMAESSPTPYVVKSAPSPRIRAYPSAA
jgi:hypothetical protein